MAGSICREHTLQAGDFCISTDIVHSTLMWLKRSQTRQKMRGGSSQSVHNPAFRSLFDSVQCGNPLDLSHGVGVLTPNEQIWVKLNK
jgi:hypothetical protein